MELELCGVERERCEASNLRPYLEILRKILQIALDPCGVVTRGLQVIDPGHWVLPASFMAVRSARQLLLPGHHALSNFRVWLRIMSRECRRSCRRARHRNRATCPPRHRGRLTA